MSHYLLINWMQYCLLLRSFVCKYSLRDLEMHGPFYSLSYSKFDGTEVFCDDIQSLSSKRKWNILMVDWNIRLMLITKTRCIKISYLFYYSWYFMNEMPSIFTIELNSSVSPIFWPPFSLPLYARPVVEKKPLHIRVYWNNTNISSRTQNNSSTISGMSKAWAHPWRDKRIDESKLCSYYIYLFESF